MQSKRFMTLYLMGHILTGVPTLLLKSRTCSTIYKAKNRPRIQHNSYKLYKVTPAKRQYEALEQLNGKKGFDFWTHHHDNSIDILVAPSRQQQFQCPLDELGIEAQVMVQDMNKQFRRVRSLESKRHRNNSPFDHYLDYDEICNYMKTLQERYPELMNVSSFGQPYEGRDLQVVRITRCEEDCPVVIMEVGTHAREWIGPAAALFVVHRLVENNTNAELLNKLDWRIIPMLNPDDPVGGSSYDYMKAVAGIKYFFTMEITKTQWGFFIPSTYIISTVPNVYNAVVKFALEILRANPQQ